MINPQQPNRAHIAERSVIGAVLIDQTVLSVAREMLDPEDFYTSLNQDIFLAMCEMGTAGTDINLASVMIALSQNTSFNEAGGIQYLLDCQNLAMSASTIESNAKLVKDDATRRKLISFSESIKILANQNTQDINGTISTLSAELMTLSGNAITTPWKSFTEAIEAACNRLIDDSDTEYIQSGFLDLDNKLTGFRPGSLTIMAARPAMGKTALGLNIAANVAFDQQLPVAFFSLEMTSDELTNRIISARARVNGNALRQKKFSEQEWERIINAAEKYHESKIYIDETPALDIAVLQDRARRMHIQYGIRILIVDYLQLMTCGAKRVQNREQEIATISRGLKGIAKELHLPVIALAQLNRSVETRAEKRPVLSDLRESGSMEQDADVVMFIHREDYYQPNAEPTHEAEVIIAKHRNGPTGVVKLHWQGEYTLFSNAEHQDEYF